MSGQWFLEEKDDALSLRHSGKSFRNEQGEICWSITPIDENRVLLAPDSVQKGMHGGKDAVFKCSVELYSDLLIGCSERKFSGLIAVDVGSGIKKIYFQEGDICFAASNLMDDRLGEVIYRAGGITLDQMTESAVAVNRTTKFGKVLLNSRIFSTFELWEALKQQTLEIVRSTFLTDSVYVHVQSGASLAPTAVVFQDSTPSLVRHCSAFGAMFRSFCERVTHESSVRVCDNEPFWTEPEQGTFFADFVSMIREAETVGQVVEKSKLATINTLLSLFILGTHRKLNFSEVQDHGRGHMGVALSRLRGLLDAHELLLKSCREAFEADNVPFPLKDLSDFVESLNHPLFPALSLGIRGEFSRFCVMNLYSKCLHHPMVTDEVLHQLQATIQFLMQITMDLLPAGRGKDVNRQFLELL